jgi:hypothetical protein
LCLVGGFNIRLPRDLGTQGAGDRDTGFETILVKSEPAIASAEPSPLHALDYRKLALGIDGGLIEDRVLIA